MLPVVKAYCDYDLCSEELGCDHCVRLILVDRTYADTIKVTLPCGYTQKFWVDIDDRQAIERCFKMKEEGIK
jgi:hypothetical protein